MAASSATGISTASIPDAVLAAINLEQVRAPVRPCPALRAALPAPPPPPPPSADAKVVPKAG